MRTHFVHRYQADFVLAVDDLGRKHGVKQVWAYMLFGQQVAIFVATNLFFLSLPPSIKKKPTSARGTATVPPILWLSVLASLVTVLLVLHSRTILSPELARDARAPGHSASSSCPGHDWAAPSHPYPDVVPARGTAGQYRARSHHVGGCVNRVGWAHYGGVDSDHMYRSDRSTNQQVMLVLVTVLGSIGTSAPLYCIC